MESTAVTQTPKVATSTKDVRLVGGDNAWSGRVEVYRNDTWGTVCGYGFGTRELDVTCRSLGYFDGGWLFYNAAFGEGNGSIIIENLRCQGNETDLSQCDIRYLTSNTYCHHRNDISISCRVGESPGYTEGVRLVGGDHAWSGRVEVFHNGHWGTVCDFLFDDKEADVVCRMLGYHSGGWAFASGVFGYGSGPMWAGSLNCVGNETDLKQCPSYSEWGRASCAHKEDASVSCRNGTEANITGNTSLPTLTKFPFPNK
ncbi:soluble scavenger receptor cysteine-rich domain-containing protein SSC5D-like [Ostrea edulis]|uniref:soluble scavenger receptor cysteine-rich domain-containing protein SSC5D-like n=1 Tax=Ostrea edulis TaxID=37623 RepID=UPI0024AF0637|nr:soluble scavenger receptor cysteine-rich domain-containing protein SSC5D-like [Ostrea edulis]